MTLGGARIAAEEHARLPDAVKRSVRYLLALEGSLGHNSIMRKMRPEELWASECISQALPGVTVVQHDNGTRQSMYDLNIVKAGDVIGAVEVTAAADGQSIALWNVANRPGERWIDPNLVGGWLVVLEPDCPRRLLRRELPNVLRELESRGLTEVPRVRFGQDESRLEFPEMERLKLLSARQSATEYPGSIYVIIEQPPEKSGGWGEPDGDSLLSWFDEWARDPRHADNIKKLATSSTPERHLFLIVPGLSTALFPVVNLLMAEQPPMPSKPPELPTQITHLWCASTWVLGKGLRWAPSEGWQTFDKDTPSVSRRR